MTATRQQGDKDMVTAQKQSWQLRYAEKELTLITYRPQQFGDTWVCPFALVFPMGRKLVAGHYVWTITGSPQCDISGCAKWGVYHNMLDRLACNVKVWWSAQRLCEQDTNLGG